MNGDLAAVVAAAVLFAAFLVLLCRYSLVVRRRLAAFLTARGFTVETNVPPMEVGGHRLTLWQAFTGPVAPNLTGLFVSGYTHVPSRKGPTTQYLGVLLPGQSVDDDALSRLGSAEELGRRPDGLVVALWQVMDTPDGAEAVLAKVAAALADRPPVSTKA